MLRSIETGLVQHHEGQIRIVKNLGIPILEMDMKDLNIISLDEAFKNCFILIIFGTLTSFVVFLLEILLSHLQLLVLHAIINSFASRHLN